MENAIFIHIGQSGIRMGHSFWEQVLQQCNITSTGIPLNQNKMSSLQSIFTQSMDGKFVPKAIFTDTQEDITDQLISSYSHSYINSNRQLYNKNCFVTQKDNGVNFARARYSIGRDLFPRLDDCIRKQAQKCDNLKSIVLTHSINGGTGSGISALLVDSQAVLCGNKNQTISFCVYPSHSMSNSTIQPYNSILASKELQENVTAVFPFTNQQIYSYLDHNNLYQKQDITYQHINRIISKVMTQLTCSLYLREYQVCGAFTDTLVNLVPYRRVKHLTSSISLLQHSMLHKQELVQNSFDKQNSLTISNAHTNSHISSSLFYRGEQHSYGLTSGKIEQFHKNILRYKKLKRCDWSPCPIKTYINGSNTSNIFQHRQTSCLLNISNETGIRSIFKNMIQKFQVLFERRSFYHHFGGEGLAGYEIREAREEISTQLKDLEEIEKPTEEINQLQ